MLQIQAVGASRGLKILSSANKPYPHITTVVVHRHEPLHVSEVDVFGDALDAPVDPHYVAVISGIIGPASRWGEEWIEHAAFIVHTDTSASRKKETKKLH
jgi:hypothetical protein